MQNDGSATSSILSSLSAITLLLQLIMNVANNNNNRKNENNNNDNNNNNNNVNEQVEVLLNEFENTVTAMGTGVAMMGRRRRKFSDSNPILELHLQSVLDIIPSKSRRANTEFLWEIYKDDYFFFVCFVGLFQLTEGINK